MGASDSADFFDIIAKDFSGRGMHIHYCFKINKTLFVGNPFTILILLRSDGYRFFADDVFTRFETFFALRIMHHIRTRDIDCINIRFQKLIKIRINGGN